MMPEREIVGPGHNPTSPKLVQLMNKTKNQKASAVRVQKRTLTECVHSTKVNIHVQH